MNTNELKRFAQEARKKLMQQVAAKLDYVLSADTPELRERAEQVKKLNEALKNSTREQLVDKVAYTWFNRFMALRFMDANDYQPLGVRVISPLPNQTAPELLNQAKQGDIASELKVDNKQVMDILDGRSNSSNPQNEAFKYLLIGACNHLHSVLPFLFERINDYTELLLPDDLTSEFSIVSDVVNGMTAEECQEVEIIGWLYQFYISELNDELISSKKKYKNNELAPASQLFTPKWIVQYMVDNTLGQVWSEINPASKVLDSLEYYIKPRNIEKSERQEKKSIEDVKFFEPCVGSGHILAYAFDVFYKIYEEQGYNPREIPELIITKNLFGVDIDPRAAQLASFVLIMKGRQKQRRFLRSVENNNIVPNISFYQDYEFDEKFNDASALGSLIRVEPDDFLNLEIDDSSLFAERQRDLKFLYYLLSQRYDVVVTNPPYISSNRMTPNLKSYVETQYPHCKHDLYSAFIFRCFELTTQNGFTGFMTPFVWMFIPSFEKFREQLLERHSINNLIQLEYSGFDGATVPICTFTIRTKKSDDIEASFIKLSSFKGAKMQAPKTLEAIRNRNCGWFYSIEQNTLFKIPGKRIGFWLSDKILTAFSKQLIGDKFEAKAGIVTGNDLQFIRCWNEVNHSKIKTQETKYEYSNEVKWVPVNKGGGYRKYSGNNDYILNIYDLWTEGKTNKSVRRGDVNFYYKKAITWSSVTSSRSSFRFSNNRVFNTVSPAIFSDDDNALLVALCFLNSKVSEHILPALNPTLHMLTSDVLSLPYPVSEVNSDLIVDLGLSLIEMERKEWAIRETSMEFTRNEILNHSSDSIEESIDLLVSHWTNNHNKIRSQEEQLNKEFIKAFGLNEEIPGNVPIEDVTILNEETTIENEKLSFKLDVLISQFISYSVACMFGRYSLEKEGLILATQGKQLQDYLSIIEKSKEEITFLPDDDNIIPVLDDEWFEDDIVGQFYKFLKVSFGDSNFRKNLAFVEEQIGDVRKYFVKSFYKDHIKRYKKRPIYWMFSSPKGHFRVLVYMHRYTPDTINNILNNYLREFIEKLNSRKEHFQQIQISGSAAEQTTAIKEIDKLDKMLLDCQEYEREILYKLATERIEIDLDDGVLVNYNKFGNALEPVPGLNDKKAKDKVRKFDWIDTSQIRD